MSYICVLTLHLFVNNVRAKQNGISPVPPPRRMHAASDISDISARSETPTGLEEENKKLKAEIEKYVEIFVTVQLLLSFSPVEQVRIKEAFI